MRAIALTPLLWCSSGGLAFGRCPGGARTGGDVPVMLWLRSGAGPGSCGLGLARILIPPGSRPPPEPDRVEGRRGCGLRSPRAAACRSGFRGGGGVPGPRRAAAPAFLADDGRNLAFITSAWPDARPGGGRPSASPGVPKVPAFLPRRPCRRDPRVPSFGPASCGSTSEEKVNPMPGLWSDSMVPAIRGGPWSGP